MRLVNAPIKNKVDFQDKAGISEPWRQFFDGFDVSQEKIPSLTYTTTAYLTDDDLGRLIKFDTGPGLVFCYLPSVIDVQIDSWLIIIRLGTGKLIVKAADSDTIESSSPGGALICDEVGRVAANLHLYLATETKWAIIGSTGIWRVY